MMKSKPLFSLLATASLVACVNPVGTQESGVEVPSFWARLNGQTSLDAPLLMNASVPVEQQWWKQFNDPTLDALIAEALANNKTLAIAKARVEEARANRVGAQSILFPQITANGSAQRANQGWFTQDKPVTVNQASVEARWELDLFGKNQARSAAAKAIYQSEEATRQAITVGLLSEVARSYFDLRNFERQIVLTKQNLESQKKTAELIDVQLQGALASDFDVQRAGAQVSTTESQLPSLQIAYDTSLNRLNVLLGHAPGTKDALLKAEQQLAPLTPQIIIAAPASVIATRPDIRAAERQFAASISAADAATRELFPTISLLGLFGVQDTSLMSATPWGITGSLAQPVLNFGRISSQIDAADARQQQAFLRYQQTVLEALENMENGLTNYLNETTRNASLKKAVEQNRTAAELAKQQYTSGYTGLLDVLVAERNVLEVESALTASDAKLRQDMVSIYAAAGGGWDVAEPAKDEPAKADDAPATN
jgi:NodT family efflux transporter outer membrane factor (OMF) lipoprotein